MEQKHLNSQNGRAKWHWKQNSKDGAIRKPFSQTLKTLIRPSFQEIRKELSFRKNFVWVLQKPFEENPRKNFCAL